MFNCERAKKVIEEQGRTQKWLAHRLGKEPATISRYLSGDSACPKDTAIALAAVLGLQQDSFWIETITPTQTSKKAS
jgi:plasmid maintenance system antidote protein VapI